MFSPSRSRNTHAGAQPNDTKHIYTHTRTLAIKETSTRDLIFLFCFFSFCFSFQSSLICKYITEFVSQENRTTHLWNL